MKEIKHEIKRDGLSGHVVIKIPTFKERLTIFKNAGVTGMANLEEAGLDLFMKSYDEIEKLVVSLDIKCGDHTFTSLEEFSYYAEFQELLAELTTLFFGGIGLGEKKSAQ